MLKRADQPYQVLPELPSWEYQALKESIRRYGVLLPVVKDEEGKTIDGHHREQSCKELGIKDYPIITLHGLSEEQKRDHALLLNLVRRKVTRKQLREIIAAELRRTPDISSNWLAGLLGTTPRTVNSVRKELIATCEIPRLASYRGRDGKRRKATIVVTFKAKDAQRAREALAALGEDAPRKPTELRLVERRLRKKERLGEVEGQLKLPRPQEAIRLFHCPLQNFERSADIQPGTVNLVLTDIPYGREFLPQLPDLAAFSQRVLAEGGIFATYCGVVDLPQVMEGIGRHLAYQAVAFSSWSGEGPLLHSTRFTTALIKKVLGKKTQPRTVKVQNESRTDTDPQMASFAASSSGEKPQGPVETVSDAVDKPVAVSQSAASEEKHESSVVIALQAAGKAVAALQIAFQAVENAEVFEGEAEHLDTIMTEITGLVAAIRERLLPVKSDEPLKLVS